MAPDSNNKTKIECLHAGTVEAEEYPFASKSFGSLESMRVDILGISLSTSLKRFLPKSGEPIVGTFHLPLITFIVSLTASTKVEEHFFTCANPDFPPILNWFLLALY